MNTTPANVGDTVLWADTFCEWRSGQSATVIATYDFPTPDARVIRFANGDEVAVMPRSYIKL